LDGLADGRFVLHGLGLAQKIPVGLIFCSTKELLA
jgi:hypothetical protein